MDPIEQTIVTVAADDQTDGYRMVCALVRQRLGRRRQPETRPARDARAQADPTPPAARAAEAPRLLLERPRQLWQLDMTSIWVAEHGWTYPMAIIDCCTREIVGWSLELRCRADEAIAVVERAAAVHGIQEGELTLGSDNSSAFTARRFRARLGGLGIRHRRGGYRDPESQAFIELWFGKRKNGRCG